MDPKYYGLVEMLLSFGVVLVFCIWQLRSTARAAKKTKERASERNATPDQ